MTEYLVLNEHTLIYRRPEFGVLAGVLQGDIFAGGHDGKGGTAGEHTPYYTNSTHLPVDYSTDIFDVLDLQDKLQGSYTGGTVLHGFLGEEVADTRAVRNLVRAITANYSLPYFTLTPTFSICAEHGYLKGEQPACPTCGCSTEVYSRVVGYLRPVGRWNDGKQTEYAARTPYTLSDNRPRSVVPGQDEREEHGRGATPHKKVA